MTLSGRDKKLVMLLAPIVILAAYWLLVLSPKREEAGRVGDQLARQEQRRNALSGEVGQLGTAKAGFAADYATVVRLGKAIPSTIDMPSLIVQLNRAAEGSRIGFDGIKTGSGDTSTAAPAAPAAPAPAASGGASSGSDTKAQPAGSGKDASGSSKPADGKSAAGSAAAGLTPVPLQFTLRGGFFELADFFHRLKRFVYVDGGRVSVHGRLVTIDGFELKATEFPTIEATVDATAYLTPKEQGITAGATPGGPSATKAAGSQQPGSPATPSGPAATVVPR